MTETCINYCDPAWAYISSDERRWHTAIMKLASEHPDECIIIKSPKDNDGVIYAKFPPKWVRIRPPKQLSLSEEEREIRSKRLQMYRRNDTEESEETE